MYYPIDCGLLDQTGVRFSPLTISPDEPPLRISEYLVSAAAPHCVDSQLQHQHKSQVGINKAQCAIFIAMS